MKEKNQNTPLTDAHAGQSKHEKSCTNSAKDAGSRSNIRSAADEIPYGEDHNEADTDE